jgi:hypothetical protein
VSPEHLPSKWIRHDAPNSPTDHVPQTPLPTTPLTAKKSVGVLEDDNEHIALEELRTKVRRLQHRLSESNVQLRKVLNIIRDADEKAASSPEKACSLLSDVRLQTARLRGFRDGAMPSVAVLSDEDYFTGKDDKEAKSMLISLQNKFSSNTPTFPHNTAITLLRFLRAREKADGLMA